MPIPQSFEAPQIHSALENALQEVFSNLLGGAVSSCSSGGFRLARERLACSEPDETAVPRVVGSVGFSGEVTGVLQLELDLAFASRCTAQLHGVPLVEINESAEALINDTVGEITGMAGGHFGNILCGSESRCRLTLPSIVRGNTIVMEAISSVRHFNAEFAYDNARIIAHVLIQGGAERSG